jgi:DNA-binding SARP family transcriptional activator
MQLTNDFQQDIPSNKFYPPRLDTSTSLFRSELIHKKLGAGCQIAKAIIIEAQAGQGKSVLAAQFLDHFDLRFAWYQIGPEDADPVLLLSALMETFDRRLQGFDSPQLKQIIRQGEIGPLDLSRCLNILLADLDKYLAGDFYLVFDDLHLIEQATLTLAMLDHLIDTAPPHLHFLLLSRRPLNLKSKTLRYSNNTCFLDNDDLSLSANEVEDLVSLTLNTNISNKEAEMLRLSTGGWIMGVVLATRTGIGKKQRNTPLPNRLTAPQLLDYFRDEIFSHIPEKLQYPLLQLSFLKEIPVDLAQTITGNKSIGRKLYEMMQDNFFVYPLDDDLHVFRFHHLFQEFLLHRAKNIIPSDEINLISHRAATYYLQKGSVEKALTCYAAENNYSKLEELLQQEGLELLAKNRAITLLTLLKSIPEDRLLEHGWLTLFSGLVYSEYHPQNILPLLEAARNRFNILGEGIGELLALGQIIYFHFVVSGLYHTGALLLPRVEELLLRYQNDLPVNARIMVTRNLAAGYCFFNCSMDQARRYAYMARDLAIKHNNHNGISASRFICGYAESLTGNPRECLQEIELSYSFLNAPLTSTPNKLSLRVLHLNYLSKYGDFINFDRQQELLRNSISSEIVQQTITAPYIYVWGSACLVARGRLNRAKETLLQGIESTDTAKTPHMLSQLLQWMGYIHALQGNKEEAIRTIREAGCLRNESGGPFYETFFEIMAGATYGRTGMHEDAITQLTLAIAKARQIPSEYLIATALFHRSWVHFNAGNPKTALPDLANALQIFNKCQYASFWSWEPDFMHELLAFAFKNKIEPAVVNQLARKHLGLQFLPGGKPLPFPEVSMLGPFQINLAGITVLTAGDFTPTQRTLLALLLTSPQQQLDQETIQVALWPDSPPDKARAKFDTLITRLRKVLKAAFNLPATQYLVMRKGILSLKNCRIDLNQFKKLAEQGIKHARSERYWQAGNAFFCALSLWNGPLESDSFMSSQTMQCYSQMIRLLTKMTHTWAVILAESDTPAEAIDILNKALSYDPMDDKMITLLYTLYLKVGNPLKAKETLITYRKSLRDLGYNQEQIDELLFQVASKAV